MCVYATITHTQRERERERVGARARVWCGLKVKPIIDDLLSVIGHSEYKCMYVCRVIGLQQ